MHVIVPSRVLSWVYVLYAYVIMQVYITVNSLANVNTVDWFAAMR